MTIDAMGCQTEIAERIVDAGADYCLAVKGNQPTLYQGIVDHFAKHLENEFADAPVRRLETEEQGHGRVEHRSYFTCPVPDDLPDRERWPGLKAIGPVISLLKNEPTAKVGINNKRLVAGWDEQYLEKVLFGT